MNQQKATLHVTEQHTRPGAEDPKPTDPVCRMEVKPESAFARQQHAGRMYYFCSAQCLEQFRADVVRYAAEERKKETPKARVTDEARRPAPGGKDYTCPMHPEVRERQRGLCPKCGMALEPVTTAAAATRTEYVCPMHPEIVRSEPGSCPICGMALELRTVSAEEEENPELVDMSERFRVATALTIPVLIVAMGEYIPGRPLAKLASARTWTWLELVLATPVILWAGWPFLVRGWKSIINHSLNMFTLIGLGVAVAYLYSLVAALLPGIFPASFRDQGSVVSVYFEAACVIVTLVLLGQVLELKARSQTGAAIRAGRIPV